MAHKSGYPNKIKAVVSGMMGLGMGKTGGMMAKEVLKKRMVKEKGTMAKQKMRRMMKEKAKSLGIGRKKKMKGQYYSKSEGFGKY